MSSPRKRIIRNASGLTRRNAFERDALLSAGSLVDRMRTLYRGHERMTDAPITVHRALACIGEEPGISASLLATRLGMQRPAVSHVLKGLAAGGARLDHPAATTVGGRFRGTANPASRCAGVTGPLSYSHHFPASRERAAVSTQRPRVAA